MRNTTPFIFIIMASIVTLVHAVVPHHHHREQICFNLQANHPRETDSPVQHDDCTHQEDSGSNSTQCILKHLVLVPADFFRTAHLQAIPVDLPDFFVTAPDPQNNLLPVYVAGLNPRQPETPLSQLFPDSSAGLRAPPSA